MLQQTFLYDYLTNSQKSTIYLFGYIKEPMLSCFSQIDDSSREACDRNNTKTQLDQQQFKKIVIKLVDFQIFLHIVIDYDIFDTIEQMLIQLKQIRGNNANFPTNIFDLITNQETIYEDLFYGKTFKGIYQQTGKPSHLCVKFAQFSDYTYFKKQMSLFNEQYRKYIESSNDCENKLNCEPDQQYVYGDRNEKIFRFLKNQSLMRGKQISRYPFRMSEDDNAQKYIYKLQRHYQFLISDWNSINYNNLQFDEESGRYFGIASIYHIKEIKDNNLQNPLSILSWDIEVSTLSGKFDQNGKTDDNLIICIGGSYGQFIDQEDQIQHFCICYIPCKNIKQIPVNIIQVDSEYDMILEFGKLIKQFDPSFITGFNDSSYDIPFLRDKMEWCSDKNGIKDLQKKFTQLFKYSMKFGKQYVQTSLDSNSLFKSNKMKLSANNTKDGLTFNIPGIICVDTRTYLMKTQKIEKKSLNEYLKANNLPLKIEVSFKDMNTSFRNIINNQIIYQQVDNNTNLSMQTQQFKNEIITDHCFINSQFQPINHLECESEEYCVSHDQVCVTENTRNQLNDLLVMNKIMEYCAYDADACRLLWNKRLIIQQAGQLSNLSYTPLRCVFDNADGIKVRNMVATFAIRQNISVPMDTQTSSDIRWRDTNLLKKYEKYPGAYVPEPKKGVNITPVAALDFASLYPSIIMAHNLSPENVLEPQQCEQISTLLTNNTDSFVNVPQIDKQSTQMNQMINCDQSQKSIQYSQIFVNFQKGDDSEQLRGFVLSRTEKVGIYPTILEYLFKMRKQVKQQISELEAQEESKEQQFQIAFLGTKQLAIKVFMNTFYGETGNQKSPLFDVIISGGTTSFGQKYIKEVHSTIKQKDCEIVYGDTDSVYFRPRLTLYNNPQQVSDLLNQSFHIVSKLRDEINQQIGNKTFGFLKMEFEELLCPSLFTGKKKYCGVIYKQEHTGQLTQFRECINISQKEVVLLKGIDFIKSQYPPLIKKFGNQVIEDIMNHFNSQYTQVFSNQNTIIQMFKDNYRFSTLNKQLQQIILNTFQNLYNTLINIQPNQYDQLSSKKRIRDSKQGEMQQFSERFKLFKLFKQSIGDNKLTDFINNHTEEQIETMIDIDELQDLNIQIPEQDELIDIIYIKQDNDKKLKISQKMHLLQYAIIKNKSLDINEYMKMFQTSAIRLIISSYYDENSTLIDEETDEYKIIETQAIQQAKQLFAPYMQKSEYLQRSNNQILLITQAVNLLDISFELYRKQIAKSKLLQHIDQLPVQQLNLLLNHFIQNSQLQTPQLTDYITLINLWLIFNKLQKKLQHIPNYITKQFIHKTYNLITLDQNILNDLLQLLIIVSISQTHSLTKKSIQDNIRQIIKFNSINTIQH